MRIPPVSVRRRARIEIIPLIDIIFFLLATFVMVSLSMVANKGIAVKLPSASTGVAQERKDFVTLTVTEDGALFWDKEKVTLESLPNRLKKRNEQASDLKVFIRGDEKVAFGNAVKVLDEVRKLGITRVAIETSTRNS